MPHSPYIDHVATLVPLKKCSFHCGSSIAWFLGPTWVPPSQWQLDQVSVSHFPQFTVVSHLPTHGQTN